MSKLKVCVIFGGVSTEHDVSIISGTSVISNLDKDKYDVFPIYIDKNGQWYRYIKNTDEITILELGEEIKEIEKLENIIDTLKKMDVVLPILHGIGGEDGSIQGMLEFFKIPYVGCGILSSSIGLDKVYTKAIWSKAQLPQAKYEYIKFENNEYIYVDGAFNEHKISLTEICKKIECNIKYPMFIKPSNSGSSVGIKKAKNFEELVESIKYAGTFDNKILVEEGINAREVECAILGNVEAQATGVGEIIPAEEFYSFDAKYKNSDSIAEIPAKISEEKINEIKEIAKKAYRAIDAKGMARVDFFIEKETEKVYLNEINTIPGFTKISMYPQLWEADGVSYCELLDRLINLAIK